jgi:hypothetical protein
MLRSNRWIAQLQLTEAHLVMAEWVGFRTITALRESDRPFETAELRGEFLNEIEEGTHLARDEVGCMPVRVDREGLV